MSKGIIENIYEMIGNTPLLKLKNLAQDDAANIFVKVEYFNPGGSIKDRICLGMIEEGERSGALRPGGTIVEPTSGNTGIGLALIGSARGYKVILTMPDSMSKERIAIFKAYGAEVVLTAGVDGMSGAIVKAEEIVKKTNAFMPQQFNNPANPEAHRKTTAVEIINALDGKIDAFVAGVGTGGTITGVGEVLKARDPSVKIVAVEPAASAVLSGGQPSPHKIQGIGAGFIPKVLNRAILDEIIPVEDDDAIETTRLLARKEGLLVGISSGAAVFAALRVARKLGQGKTVVAILPDTGERYFSVA